MIRELLNPLALKVKIAIGAAVLLGVIVGVASIYRAGVHAERQRWQLEALAEVNRRMAVAESALAEERVRADMAEIRNAERTQGAEAVVSEVRKDPVASRAVCLPASVTRRLRGIR